MREPLASVVIPAHDEQSVIERALRALTAGAEPGEIDIIVVANACRDRTADVARAAGVTVLETDVTGKANALRLGDEQCKTFPRLYLDADVDLDTAGLRAMVEAMGEPGVHACSPRATSDATGCSWLVRRFQSVLAELLAGRGGSLAGKGAYMLDETAHALVFPMPDVLSDDGYAHRRVPAEHQRVVDGARVVTRSPRTLAAVVRRRARVRIGNRELDQVGAAAAEPSLGLGALLGLLRAKRIAPLDALSFLTVLCAERALAVWRDRRGTSGTWSSDRTTREVAS